MRTDRKDVGTVVIGALAVGLGALFGYFFNTEIAAAVGGIAVGLIGGVAVMAYRDWCDDA